MALVGAFPLPSIAGDDRRSIADEVLLEEEEEEEDDSSACESTSLEETDDDSGADAGGSTSSSRLLPTRTQLQDPRALEAVIEAALGPNPTVSRTPSPSDLESIKDPYERFETEHRAHYGLAHAHLTSLCSDRKWLAPPLSCRRT